jgi:hypothetical protein
MERRINLDPHTVDHASVVGRHGFGFWAVEAPDVAAVVGFIGFSVPRFQAHFNAASRSVGVFHRRLGRAMPLKAPARRCDLDSTRSGWEKSWRRRRRANVRSRRVMGMVHNPADDFDHPLVPDGHPLRRHVLYGLSNPELPN